MTTEFTTVEASRIAGRVIQNADYSLGWADAGYSSPLAAAKALVGDGYDADVRDLAAQIVCDAIFSAEVRQ